MSNQQGNILGGNQSTGLFGNKPTTGQSLGGGNLFQNTQTGQTGTTGLGGT